MLHLTDSCIARRGHNGLYLHRLRLYYVITRVSADPKRSTRGECEQASHTHRSNSTHALLNIEIGARYLARREGGITVLPVLDVSVAK